MRNLRLLALVAPLLWLPLACEDGAGSSSGPPLSPEASTFEGGPSAEAGPSPEAGLPDTSPPAPLGVTVTVTEDVLPRANVRVLLQDAAGLVIGEKTTDATGRVTVATAPSMVTVLIARGAGAGSSVDPVTFAGVADGDRLVVASAADVLVDAAPVGTYSVTFTDGVATANASTFNVFAARGCTGVSPLVGVAAVVDLYPGCLFAKNAVLTEAANVDGLVGYGFAKDVAKPAPAGVVDVGPLAFAAPGAVTLNATHVPVTDVTVVAGLYAIANSATFAMSFGSGAAEGGGRTWKTPTGFPEAFQSVISFDQTNPTSRTHRLSVRREAVPANNLLTDVDYASALPQITNAVLTTATAARPEVVLTTGAPTTNADGGVATFHWSDLAAGTSGSWTVVFPASTTTIKIPALPADATTFLPGSNVSIDEVLFVEATQLPGYKELKLLPIQPNAGVDIVNPALPLPQPGTVRVTRWTALAPG